MSTYTVTVRLFGLHFSPDDVQYIIERAFEKRGQYAEALVKDFMQGEGDKEVKV